MVERIGSPESKIVEQPFEKADHVESTYEEENISNDNISKVPRFRSISTLALAAIATTLVINQASPALGMDQNRFLEDQTAHTTEVTSQYSESLRPTQIIFSTVEQGDIGQPIDLLANPGNVSELQPESNPLETQAQVFEEHDHSESLVEGEWWRYPDVIQEALRNGDDLLVLVNKEYRLPNEYEPSDLVLVTESGIRTRNGAEETMVREILIDDLRALNEAAKEAGIDISIRSAYRSYYDQNMAYRHWLDFNEGDIDLTDKSSARPGHSQHQLGTTIDFSSREIQDGIGPQFHNTEAAIWLAENAWRYGFVIGYPEGAEHITGYTYESWHYRYIGVENAKAWKESGLPLELWLRQQNALNQ